MPKADSDNLNHRSVTFEIKGKDIHKGSASNESWWPLVKLHASTVEKLH